MHLEVESLVGLGNCSSSLVDFDHRSSSLVDIDHCSSSLLDLDLCWTLIIVQWFQWSPGVMFGQRSEHVYCRFHTMLIDKGQEQIRRSSLLP